MFHDELFAPEPVPPLTVKSLEDVVLLMKSLDYRSISNYIITLKKMPIRGRHPLTERLGLCYRELDSWRRGSWARAKAVAASR